MPRKIHITLLFSLVLATFALFAATPDISYGSETCEAYPCSISNFNSFLDNQCDNYFNTDSSAEVCEPLGTFDFDGFYYFTAIATEACRDLSFKWPASDPRIVFNNKVRSIWGLFAMIDFEDAPPVFIDGTDQVPLDPNTTDIFKICRLTQNSNLLSYLPNPIRLFAGDIIIGFDDFANAQDFDDLIMVARPIEEPASSQPLAIRTLFNTAEVNFFLLFNLKGDSFDVECAKLVSGEWVSDPGGCQITTLSLGDLKIENKTFTFAPFNKPWGASTSPGCSYVRTRSGGVKKVCK